MTKQVVILHVSETEPKTVLDHIPTFDEMRTIIGCTMIEHVQVLDRVEGGTFVFTSMFVDEESLLKDSPKRNPLATVAYQRNIRAQFPDDPNPFRTAKAASKKYYEKLGFGYIDAEIPSPGYDPEDPHIAGVAILFEGWTTEEVNAHFEKEEEEE